MGSFENKEYFRPIFNTVKELLKAEDKKEIVSILENAEITVTQTGYDNWNGGIDCYTLYIYISVPEYVKLDIEKTEVHIKNALDKATRHINHEAFEKIIISPISNNKIDWSLINIPKRDLIDKVNYLKNTMISVSTGGPQIQIVDNQYKQTFNEVQRILKKLGIENPNKYESLWDWYGKWSNNFNTYQERRNYINQLYKQLFDILSDEEDTKIVDIKIDLSSWEKINRTIIEINNREKQAKNEEQYQAVGMLCRELIITLAQTVYNSERHPSTNEVKISKTDANRMLDAYIGIVLAGDKNEELRVYAKATNKLANLLTHKRTATKKEMMLCTSATLALINFIGILEDKI